MKRALLVAGGFADQPENERYQNDLLLWWGALRGRGFDVRALLGGLDGRIGEMDIRAATLENIEAELEWLAALADADDEAVLVVSNHGSKFGFCTWGEDFATSVTPSRVADALRASPSLKILVFGQCYAGIFGTMNVDRAVICGACAADEISYACGEDDDFAADRPYDEFLFHLGSAVARRDITTWFEAFEGARRADRRPEHPFLVDAQGFAARIRL